MTLGPGICDQCHEAAQHLYEAGTPAYPLALCIWCWRPGIGLQTTSGGMQPRLMYCIRHGIRNCPHCTETFED